MLIPTIDRRFLKSIGHPHWFWKRTYDWAFGERYLFRDGSIAYCKGGKITAIRKGMRILWCEGKNKEAEDGK